MACGIVLIILCLVLAFTGSTLSFRGPLLVIGAVAFFLGLYLYPTVFHHRTIVNVIFLFPLLFTFVVTVILPFALGIFYSLTGGTPARMMGSTIYSNGTEMLPLISTFRDAGNFLGISMLQSYPGIIFAYLGFGGAMTVFILTGFIKGIPYELEEAAAIDGCSPEGTFFKIVFPLLKPVEVTVTIPNGMWIWNDYLLPSMMLGQNGKIKTLPVAVQAFVGSYVKQRDLILSAALLAMLPMIILFLLAQKQIMSGMVEGAIK